MILDQVTQRPGVVVVARAALDPYVLGGRDLHAVDKVAVPHRLEQSVGEPEGHQVLNRLFAEVVVDPEDLGLPEDLQEVGIQLARGVEV